MKIAAPLEVVVIGGGQSGLAAAWALRTYGPVATVLEAEREPLGSWPSYYDSLTLFSPARFSALPGVPFPGDPNHYPHRDEVVDYLRGYAKQLDADVRTATRVSAVRHESGTFHVTTDNGDELTAHRVIAATGGFGRPHRPALPGLETFTGQVLHASDYRDPTPFAGQRIVVVGAGNSAVQIAVELAALADVTLATRNPINFVPQRPFGRDLHFWSTITGLDSAPLGRFVKTPLAAPVLDTGIYRDAIGHRQPDRRAMFQRIDTDTVLWADDAGEHVDTILLATGYRPDLNYLAPLGALDEIGRPQHRRGLSTTHRGLGYVGLEWQRSLSSATLRGVGRDARYVVKHLARHR